MSSLGTLYQKDLAVCFMQQASSLLRSDTAFEIKTFASTGQLIVVTSMQAVILPTTTVTRLPFPFDKN